METVKSFCEVMEKELTKRNAMVEAALAEVDKMSTGDKEKIASNIRQLHILAQEVGDRVAALKRECPTDWEGIKAEIEGKLKTFKTGYEDLPQDLKAAVKDVSVW